MMSEQQNIWDRCMQCAAISDVGMRRSNNQDSYAVALASDENAWRERGHIFMVADGMGAHAAGELASKLAVDNIPHLYRKYRDQSAPEALQKAVLETNAKVYRHGADNQEFHNMGTTCSVLTLLPQGAVLAHIGDSRIYRQRGNRFEQLTFDHSLVWEMRAAGQLPENSELSHMVPKNVITRSLGPNAAVKVDIEGPFPVEVGDTFLLCSDGLTGPVRDEEIGPLMATLSPQEVARVLIDLANLRGGPDNITVIVVRVTGPELTTAVAGTEPLTIGGDRVQRKVHPVLWALMGACLLAASGLAVLSSWIPAGLAAVGGLVLLGTALLQKFRGGNNGVELGRGQRFGKGPHASFDSTAKPELIDTLVRLIDELRQAASEKKWDINASHVDELCSRGYDANAAGKHAEALRQYARAISFLMQELRSQRKKKPSDSTIDLA